MSERCKVPITESQGSVSHVLCSNPPQPTHSRSVINGLFEGQIVQGVYVCETCLGMCMLL